MCSRPRRFGVPLTLRLLLRLLRRIASRVRNSVGLVVAVLLVLGGCKSTRADYPTDVKVFLRLDELASGQIFDQVSGVQCTWNGTDAVQMVGSRNFKSIATNTGGVTVPATILDAIRPGGFWKGPHSVCWWQYGPEASGLTGVLAVAGVPGQWYPFMAPTGGDYWFDDRYVRGLQLVCMQPQYQVVHGYLVPEWNAVTLGGTWSLIVVRWDPTNGGMSLNKNETKWYQSQPVNTQQHLGGGGGSFTLGTNGNWAGPGARLIGSLGIFDRVITDAEVTELVNLGPGYIPDYWDEEDPGEEEPGGGGPEFSQLVAVIQGQTAKLSAIQEAAEATEHRLTGLYFYAIAGVECLVVLAGFYLFRIAKFSMNSKSPFAIAAVFVSLAGSSFAQPPEPCKIWEQAVGANLNGNYPFPTGPFEVECLGASSVEMENVSPACNISDSVRRIRIILRYHEVADGADHSGDVIVKAVTFTTHGSGPGNSDAFGETRAYFRPVSAAAGDGWEQMPGYPDVTPCKDCGECATCIYAELFEIYADGQQNPYWPKGRGSRQQYEEIGSGDCTPPPGAGTGSGGDPGGGTGGVGGGTPFPGGPGQDDDDDGVPNGQDPDRDGDGIPNGDDPDRDGDGIPNPQDPEPDGPPDDGPGTNPGDPGNDNDDDGVDDPEDPDDDNDGIPDDQDPSQYGGCVLANGGLDTDCDGIVDSEDPCIATIKNDSDCDDVRDQDDICAGHDDLADGDNDGVPDGCDNCPASPNPQQKNSDNDEFGDPCDDDDDNDGKDDNEDDDDDGDGIPDVDEDQCEEAEGEEQAAQCGCARILDSFYYRLYSFLTGDRADVGAGYRTGDGDPGSANYVPGGEGGIFTYLFDSRRKISSWGQPASGGNGEDPPEEEPGEGTPETDKNRLPIPFVDLKKFKDFNNYNLPTLEYKPIELDWDEGVFYDSENVLEWDFLDIAHMIKNIAAIGLIWSYGSAIIFAFFKSAT